LDILQGVWALEFLSRGEKTRIAPAADVRLNDSPCIRCGRCSACYPRIYDKLGFFDGRKKNNM